jgi:hypothetical protein
MNSHGTELTVQLYEIHQELRFENEDFAMEEMHSDVFINLYSS